MTSKEIDRNIVIHYQNEYPGLVELLAIEQAKVARIEALIVSLENCGCPNDNCESQVAARRFRHHLECDK
jgi:hypothetical protein